MHLNPVDDDFLFIFFFQLVFQVLTIVILKQQNEAVSKMNMNISQHSSHLTT